jgi:hypothetical protein
MSDNKMNIDGEGNVALQDVTANNITINIAGDLPADVKQQKETLKLKVAELAEELSALKELEQDDEENNDFDPPDDPAYESIEWNRIVQALRHEKCILFIGPEISVDEQGNSLHHEYYVELASMYKNVEYPNHDGLFSPGSDKKIEMDIMDYYGLDDDDFFMKRNIIGRKLLKELARIRFNLIVSLCPDDTMHSIFDDYDLNHKFLVHDGTKQDVDKPDAETPVIYNVLGNASDNGKYIFTHKSLYEYLNEVSLPPNIKETISEATHFIFIGFDFDKWYNRLLFFILNIEPANDDDNGQRLVVGDKDIKEDVASFIEKQFTITSIKYQYDKFTEWLIQNASKRKLVRDLNQIFIKKNFSKLQSYGDIITDEDSKINLTEVENKLKAMEKKIKRFKSRLI